jgi:hypothetical protein
MAKPRGPRIKTILRPNLSEAIAHIITVKLSARKKADSTIPVKYPFFFSFPLVIPVLSMKSLMNGRMSEAASGYTRRKINWTSSSTSEQRHTSVNWIKYTSATWNLGIGVLDETISL